jgi:hypothetical protein
MNKVPESDWTWISKKQPVYCRPHGERIVGFINGVGYCQRCLDLPEKGFDKYGNPLDGSRLINCCFPDCGCDGARLCMAEKGPNGCACQLNLERQIPENKA